MTISDPESANPVTINNSRPRCQATVRRRPGSNRCQLLTLDNDLVIEMGPTFELYYPAAPLRSSLLVTVAAGLDQDSQRVTLRLHATAMPLLNLEPEHRGAINGPDRHAEGEKAFPQEAHDSARVGG
jgi:hypothetical protein